MIGHPLHPLQIDPDIEQKALTLPDQARALLSPSLIVTDQSTYTLAASKLLDIAALRREIQAYHKPLKQAANLAHKTICDAEAKLLSPVSQAEEILKRGIALYEQNQKRIQLKAQIEAEEREKKRAEDERLARAQIVEDKITDLTIGLEIDQAQSWEEAEEIARKAKESGQRAADEIRASPLEVQKVHVPGIERVHGVQTVERWSAEVVDMKELCRAVGAGEVSVSLVLPNMPNLNRMAVVEKAGMKVRGVRAVKETGVRTGR
jgi:hypothetical protein